MSPRPAPQVIAHRGASADFRENTVDAFRGAVQQHADWAELDVRLTRAGELVVHHDAWFGDGRDVYSTPASERPGEVIELSAALDACAGIGVNVEIKNSPGDLGPADVPHDLAVARLVIELLDDRHRAALAEGVQPQPILISSFDEATLQVVRTDASHLETALLVFDLAADRDCVERSAAAGDTALHPWDAFVTAELVERCHQVGLRVNSWTVDDPDRVRELVLLGADGIVTNMPANTRSVLSG